MASPFLAEIKMFGGNFPPHGYAFCNGQIMSIAQNTALFSLLGTTYGGNGTTNFALPDLQGRLPMHWGNGLGLSPRVIGEISGQENVSLIIQNMPMHSHQLFTNNSGGSSGNPQNGFLAASTARDKMYAASTDGTALNPQAVGLQGQSLPHENMPPFLTVSFIIALVGIYPSRN